MTTPESPFLGQIQSARAFFERTTASLTEDDSAFCPRPEMFSVAQQVAHVAHTVEWFLDGALKPEGFALDFEAQEAHVRETTTLEAARAQWARAMDRAVRVLEETAPEVWGQPLPEGPILPGCPKASIWGGIVEHTAHHRGVLSVYLRLLGRVPAMPYGDA